MLCRLSNGVRSMVYERMLESVIYDSQENKDARDNT